MISKIDISTKESFTKNKKLIQQTFEKAIKKTAEKMGDDIKGVQWFNPRWEDYTKSRKG